MTPEHIKQFVQSLVASACVLSDKHTTERGLPVNYVCIFSHTESEYETLLALMYQMEARVAQETAMGPVFHVAPISTVVCDVNLLKIRRPDPKRPQRGDVDFTLPDYQKFKETHLGKPGFDCTVRPNMEMIELADPVFDVLVYYSHPPLSEVLLLKTQL